MLKSLKRLRVLYTECLKNHPMKVQSIQAGLLMATGDLISQNLIEEGPYDGARTMRFTVVGLTLGPALMVWYRTLDSVVGKSSYHVAKKVALDQILAAPSLLLVVQTGVCLFEGKSLEETKEKLQYHYYEMLLNNYKVWPLVQTVNFSIVPLEYRVLFTQVIAVFWNTYLAFKMHQKVPSE